MHCVSNLRGMSKNCVDPAFTLVRVGIDEIGNADRGAGFPLISLFSHICPKSFSAGLGIK
jgi:hypothetical protein